MGKVINISNYERKEVWLPTTLTIYEPEPDVYAISISQGKKSEEIDLKQNEIYNIRKALYVEMMNYDRYNEAQTN